MFNLTQNIPDGRVMTTHIVASQHIDFGSNVLHVIIRSWTSDSDCINNLPTWVEFQADIPFITWGAESLLTLEQDVQSHTWTLITELPKPPKPDQVNVYDWDGTQWVFNLEASKSLKMQALDNAYNAANNGTFDYSGHTFNADSTAKNNFLFTSNTIALTGAFPTDFHYVWEDINGDVIPITTIDDFKNLFAAVVSQGNSNYLGLKQLEAQVMISTTAAQLDAISW